MAQRCDILSLQVPATHTSIYMWEREREREREREGGRSKETKYPIYTWAQPACCRSLSWFYQFHCWGSEFIIVGNPTVSLSQQQKVKKKKNKSKYTNPWWVRL